jgi:uncharacterized membrane protein
MTNEKGFIATLFDFSFTEFIALKVIGLLYGLLVALAGLGAVGILFGALSQGFGNFLGALIFAPLFFLIYVVFARIALEALVISFRNESNNRRTAENTETLRR